ncbi:tRNA (adenosine(37)-N6)-dimethylallyltransferase MiaA [Patescibacteria group bacterium]|nr:tRNA (adenosine(37)-N6)-dimethylallyltransferase MiaA [Patescibacteria group bacterium]
MQNLIVIVGPTASGKSTLGVRLAKKFKGEIISADSRQTYKGMDIGSGKIRQKEMQSIPHHLLGVANPKRRFSVAQYQKLALRAIRQIHARGNLPLLVGGSPFYIYAVIDGIVIPKVKPDAKLRATLEKMSREQLYMRLQKLDPRRAQTIEKRNKRRLIRALEIVMITGKPVPKLRKKKVPFEIIMLGIKKSPAELKKLIHNRLLWRLKAGMIAEVKKLHDSGVSWKRLEEFGLEYKFVAQYLESKISKQEMIDSIEKEILQFARRQMTWFKKDPRIKWIKNSTEAVDTVHDFLS